jgi:protein-tyrosine phosphatase
VPYRVCFVCLGNICRSPMSAAVMTSMVNDAGLADQMIVSSAGTGGWHVGGPADERAIDALRRGGYDGRHHRARQITSSWFDDLDLVLAHDASNLKALRNLAPKGQQSKVRLLREFDPVAVSDRDVPDPYYGESGDFDEVLALVERSCRGLLDQLNPGLTSRRPGP